MRENCIIASHANLKKGECKTGGINNIGLKGKNVGLTKGRKMENKTREEKRSTQLKCKTNQKEGKQKQEEKKG